MQKHEQFISFPIDTTFSTGLRLVRTCPWSGLQVWSCLYIDSLAGCILDHYICTVYLTLNRPLKLE